jgi:protein-tyrosine-phosphatase
LPEALSEGARLGVDLTAHRARPLRGQDLSGADLVLGFERTHVAAAVVDGGAPLERTFTMPELAGLLDSVEAGGDGDPAARARRIVEVAGRTREHDPRIELVPEVADPFGAPGAVYRETADTLDRLTGRLARGLFGAGEQ